MIKISYIVPPRKNMSPEYFSELWRKREDTPLFFYTQEFYFNAILRDRVETHQIKIFADRFLTMICKIF